MKLIRNNTGDLIGNYKKCIIKIKYDYSFGWNYYVYYADYMGVYNNFFRSKSMFNSKKECIEYSRKCIDNKDYL